VIPAHPLALTPRRTLDERRQSALTRYYIDAGAGGSRWASTRRNSHPRAAAWLLQPVLELAATTARAWKNGDRMPS
jgi:hypothetical protein